MVWGLKKIFYGKYLGRSLYLLKCGCQLDTWSWFYQSFTIAKFVTFSNPQTLQGIAPLAICLCRPKSNRTILWHFSFPCPHFPFPNQQKPIASQVFADLSTQGHLPSLAHRAASDGNCCHPPWASLLPLQACLSLMNAVWSHHSLTAYHFLHNWSSDPWPTWLLRTVQDIFYL